MPRGFDAFRVADHVALLIVLRVLPVGSGDVLPRVEHMHAMLLGFDLGPSSCIARWMWPLISRRDSLSGETTNVRSGERTYSRAISPMRSVPVSDLMHAALAVEIADGLAHFATRKLLHGLFERRVFLPDDLIQVRRANPRFLQLRIGPASFDRLMLPRVADEQHTIIFL